MKKVYISHPFSENIADNAEKIREICQQVSDRDILPIAPQLYLPYFVDELTQREKAMRFCLELITLCDEVWVYGDHSQGMTQEIEFAQRQGIRVVEMNGARAQSGLPCPDCGSSNYNPSDGGCSVCRDCGYSPCG